MKKLKIFIYKEIINEISKKGEKVEFKPKYVITFDRDLTKNKVSQSYYKKDKTNYPYKCIFQDELIEEDPIIYGVIRLGEAPILYYIYIDLQKLIKFIKTLPLEEIETPKNDKITEETPEIRRNRLIGELIAKKLNSPIENEQKERQEELNRLIKLSSQEVKGDRGKLSVTLSWGTTDDLDLHIDIAGNNKIYYGNKTHKYGDGFIGKLDIDANVGDPLVSNPQENVYWDNIPEGKHTISVDFFNKRENKDKVEFQIYIDNGEDSRLYSNFVESTGKNKIREVATFEFKDNKLEITDLINR